MSESVPLKAERTASSVVPWSPLDSIPDMRATAKWIAAAAAAVGAALLGGAPIAAVGKIHGLADAVMAYVGLAVGLFGVGWVIWHTADALIPPLTTPASLDTERQLKSLRDRIDHEPTAFYGPFGASMTDLTATIAFHQKVAANLTVALAAEQNAARQKILADALDGARLAVAAGRQRAFTLLELAHAWQVRAQLRRARLHALVGAGVAAAGVVIFLASTSTAVAKLALPTPGPAFRA